MWIYFIVIIATRLVFTASLLAIVDILAVQSSSQTFIHNAILFTDTSNIAWHNQAYWLIGTPYLSTSASNV